MTGANTVHFIEHVMACFPECHILFLLDRASWHKGDTRAFIEAHSLLDLLYFPPACPDMNPQEHVWKLACEADGHLHDYAHIGDLRQAFQAHFDQTLFDIRWVAKYLPPILLRL